MPPGAVPAPRSRSPGYVYLLSGCSRTRGLVPGCLQGLRPCGPPPWAGVAAGGCGAQGRRAWTWARLPAPHGLFLVPRSTGTSRRAVRLAREGVNYGEFEASAQRVVLIRALRHPSEPSGCYSGGRRTSGVPVPPEQPAPAVRRHRPRAPSSLWLPRPRAALCAPGGPAPSAGAAGSSPRPRTAPCFGDDPGVSRAV